MEYVLEQSWRNVLRAVAQIVDNIRGGKKARRMPMPILCTKTRFWNLPLLLFIISYKYVQLLYTVELGLCDTVVITLYIQWCQLIHRRDRVFLPRLVRHT